MRVDWTISTAVHVVVITLGMVSFTWTKPRDDDAPEFIPVNVISDSDVSKVTAGVKNVPKPAEEPKPLVEKIGDPKPVKQLAPKVVDKPEVTTDTSTKSEPKPEKVEKPKPPQFKPDQIAEELKKDEAKKPPKQERKWAEFKPDQIAEQLRKDDPKKQPPKFDANQVSALLDKREPQRQTAIGDTLNGTVGLGAPTGHAAKLSQNELDALRAKLVECWNPPPGLNSDSKLYVLLHVTFKQSGFLAYEPSVVEDSAASLGPALAESAKRALMKCQPYNMLKPEHYDVWKEIDIKFNNELLGG